MSGALARPLLAGIFIYGGVDALRDPEGKAKAADDVAPMIAEAFHLPTTDTVTLVRINGGIQAVAGTMLALGKWRRFSALVLAASLVPTTYAGHRFWEEMDEDRRAQQRIQFLKNAAMLGGLALAASDTGGRASVPWQARRAAAHAVEATVAAGSATQDAAKHLLASSDDARQTMAGAGAAASDLAAHLTQLAKDTDLTAVSKRAAKAARKAQKAELTRRAFKAAKKAERMAAKADVTRRAVRMAKKARKSAVKMAKKAELAQRSSAVANKAMQAASETVSWAREAVPDDTMERVRDRAVTLAHHAADRVSEALPVAS